MKQKGFTLVELLVVISIIGLLSSVVMTSLSAARQKAQIAKFKQEAKTLANAFELYRSYNNSYPELSERQMDSSFQNTYLGSYLKQPVFIPNTISSDPLYYSSNKFSGNTLYSCGDTTGKEEYVVTFSTNTTIGGQFPKLYWYTGSEWSLWPDWYCVYIPPK